MRDPFCALEDPSHVALPVLGFLRCSTMKGRAAFSVTEETETLFGLVNADDIC